MAKYTWNEAIERIYRKLRGDTISNVPEVLTNSQYSSDEALTEIAEILQGSGGENLHMFVPVWMHPVTSAPTGTALGYLGGNLYAQNGSLMWYGSSGTITTIAGS